jgi:hypothetical protein
VAVNRLDGRLRFDKALLVDAFWSLLYSDGPVYEPRPGGRERRVFPGDRI